MRNCTAICFIVFLVFHLPLYAISVSGKVTKEIDGSPIEFGRISVVELKQKASIRNGKYVIQIQKPGEYTFLVMVPGLKSVTKKIKLAKDQTLDFVVESAKVRGRSLYVREKREVQTLSRNTLNQKDLKNVPATFGDSLNAVTSLPGINRTIDLFGPLVVRGADQFANRYFIDGIPVLNPQHFGAFQSVISNDLVDKIDFYSSSFPVNYGDALGGVIDIKTIDEVEQQKNFVNFSLLSADAYTQFPLSYTIPTANSNLTENGITNNKIKDDKRARPKQTQSKGKNETSVMRLFQAGSVC